MVMNGDTMLEADLPSFIASHRNAGTAASMLCAWASNPLRYGLVEIDSLDRVTRFVEKSGAPPEPGWVNAGVYLFDRSILELIGKLAHGSLERDILQAMPPGSIHAYRTEGRFLDIGTPESMAQASKGWPS